MTSQPDDRFLDKRFLIGVLVFGITFACTGYRWLFSDSQGGMQIAGTIGRNDSLFYPLSACWLGLGITMVALAVFSFFSSKEIYLKLAAYSCLAIILLGFGTGAAAFFFGS